MADLIDFVSYRLNRDTKKLAAAKKKENLRLRPWEVEYHVSSQLKALANSGQKNEEYPDRSPTDCVPIGLVVARIVARLQAARGVEVIP